MWSARFEGLWLMVRRIQAAFAPRLANDLRSCPDVRTAADSLSAHLLRDIGLHEPCGCEKGAFHD